MLSIVGANYVSDDDTLEQLFRRQDDEVVGILATRMEPFVVRKWCAELGCTELELKQALKDLVESNRINQQRRNIAIGALITAAIGSLGAWVFGLLQQWRQ